MFIYSNRGKCQPMPFSYLYSFLSNGDLIGACSRWHVGGVMAASGKGGTDPPSTPLSDWASTAPPPPETSEVALHPLVIFTRPALRGFFATWLLFPWKLLLDDIKLWFRIRHPVLETVNMLNDIHECPCVPHLTSPSSFQLQDLRTIWPLHFTTPPTLSPKSLINGWKWEPISHSSQNKHFKIQPTCSRQPPFPRPKCKHRFARVWFFRKIFWLGFHWLLI